MPRAPGQASLFGGMEPPRRYAPKVLSPRPAGYAAQPGTGPEGETCGTCAHCRKKTGHAKVFYKCALMLSAWTHGRDSDVLLKSPACKQFQPGSPAESHVSHVRRDWSD